MPFKGSLKTKDTEHTKTKKRKISQNSEGQRARIMNFERMWSFGQRTAPRIMGERSSNRLGIYVLMGRGTTDCRFNSINVDCDEEQMFKCLNLEMFTASIFQIVDIEWTDNQRRSRPSERRSVGTVGRYSREVFVVRVGEGGHSVLCVCIRRRRQYPLK